MIARGHVHQCTDLERLDEVARGGVTGYIGYDLTAPSLHVGNLATIMLLRRLQQGGGRPIVLMGGGTTRVGDPSGKDETRKILSPETIAANKESQKSAFAKFLDFGEGGAILVDNSDWLLPLNYIDFLRDVGPHFTINRMLTMDSVKLRLDREQPLTFIEFNYMILQAYDFVELYKRHGCQLQMGGSDQWGNIVNGVDLGRRMRDAELFGVTTPLLTTASGAKMGKSVDGAVWLNPDLRSPYEYWQFWRNTEDADVIRFCACSPICRWRKSGGLKSCRARRSMTPRKFSPRKRPRCCTAVPLRSTPKTPRALRLSKAVRPPACRRSTSTLMN